jgi:hypothetical protein
MYPFSVRGDRFWEHRNGLTSLCPRLAPRCHGVRVGLEIATSYQPGLLNT